MDKTSQLRKETPVFSGVLMYFPDALAEIARLSWAGNQKHNAGEPLHWSRHKSSDHLDCLARHLLEWDKLDDDGFIHLVKVAWRALAQLQLEMEARRVEENQRKLEYERRKVEIVEGQQMYSPSEAYLR